jgi:hypothetical protein
MGQLHHEVHVLPVEDRRIGALYGNNFFLVSVMEDHEASGLVENTLSCKGVGVLFSFIDVEAAN